jgi:hypothetical protein
MGPAHPASESSLFSPGRSFGKAGARLRGLKIQTWTTRRDFFHGFHYPHCAPAGRNLVQGAGEGFRFPRSQKRDLGHPIISGQSDLGTHPSLEKNEGWGTRLLRECPDSGNSGRATRPAVESRALPPFVRKKRRMGHPLLREWSDSENSGRATRRRRGGRRYRNSSAHRMRRRSDSGAMDEMGESKRWETHCRFGCWQG